MVKDKSKLCCLYIRVSTQDQKKHGYSVEAQIDVLTKYSEELGFAIVKIYEDTQSGGEMSRKDFQTMLEDAKKGKFGHILVLDDSRFMRDVAELWNTIRKLKEDDVYLHIKNFPVEFYTPEGEMILTSMASFSQLERKKISMRTRYGIKQKMKNEWFGQAPYGYKVTSKIEKDRKFNHLDYNFDEQNIIRIIKNLDDRNLDIDTICTLLNKMGHKTRRDKSWNKYNLKNVLKSIKTDYSKYIYE